MNDFSKQDNEILALERVVVPETNTLQQRIIFQSAGLSQLQQETSSVGRDKGGRWWMKILPMHYALAFSMLLMVMSFVVWLPLGNGVKTTELALQQQMLDEGSQMIEMQTQAYEAVSLGVDNWQGYFLLEEEMMLSQL